MTEGPPIANKITTPTYVKLADVWERKRQEEILITEYTYNDFTIIPVGSQVRKSGDTDISTELLPGISMEVPIVSANMHTITEDKMAILMAQIGGMGIIHRALTIEEQVRQVQAVKNVNQNIIEHPATIRPDDTVGMARTIMEQHRRGYVLVAGANNEFLGIATSRDVGIDAADATTLITDVMTPKEIVVFGSPDISPRDAKTKMDEARKEKLPLLDAEGRIVGVITARDIRMLRENPLATRDDLGRLRVGAAIGVEESSLDRAAALIGAGVDFLVIDVLHGDSPQVFETLDALQQKKFQKLVGKTASLKSPVPIMAGNVATGLSTRKLIDSGASGVKVGYGPGAVCTTQEETGTGRPQGTTVVETSAAAYNRDSGEKDATINADGDIRVPGDMVKALALGADHVMVGSFIKGTEETPGEPVVDEDTGIAYKNYTGMASTEANQILSEVRGVTPKERSPQGVSTRVVFRGSAKKQLNRAIDGLHYGLANAGVRNIQELQEKVWVAIRTQAGQEESRAHGKK